MRRRETIETHPDEVRRHQAMRWSRRLLHARRDSTLCHPFPPANGVIQAWTAVKLRGADGAVIVATNIPTTAYVTAGGRAKVPRSTSRKETDASRNPASEMGETERSHHHSFGWLREMNGRARGDKGKGWRKLTPQPKGWLLRLGWTGAPSDNSTLSLSCINSLFSSRRLVVQALLGFRLESPTRLSGQVGRLAGDLSFPVD
jgi:hypothetical protein